MGGEGEGAFVPSSSWERQTYWGVLVGERCNRNLAPHGGVGGIVGGWRGANDFGIVATAITTTTSFLSNKDRFRLFFFLLSLSVPRLD